jgi:FkbM family methyltransferase
VNLGFGRDLIERFSRRRVLKRHLPADLGACPLLVSPDASLRFWKAKIESDLFDFAREFVRPGSVVWDIGANVGLFSVAAAQRAGQSGWVIAVEADIWLAGLLEQSAALQPATSARICVVPAAASDSISLKEFNIARRGRASNFLSGTTGSLQTGGIRCVQHVVSITPDWLLEQSAAPEVVKIDVEGAELDVLRGGLRVIASARPVVLCEVKFHADEVTRIFSELGYSLYDWDAHPRVPVSRACCNTLAVPTEA